MPPARVYRTRAVVLRRMDMGETDRILTLYTREFGKTNVLAKGVRKPGSRKAGHVELFMLIDVLIARGRSLDILTQVETIETFLPVRNDLLRTTYAAHIVELLDAFVEEGDTSTELFDLLASGLNWVATTENLPRTARYYELAILDLAGYRPELFRCVICGEEITPQDQFYSAQSGGVICPECAPGQPYTRPLSLRTLKVLRYMQKQPFNVIEQLQISQVVQTESERLLHQTLAYYLERRLRSAAFLTRLRRDTKNIGKTQAQQSSDK